MPIPAFIQSLRETIGHDLLLLPGVCALVFDGREETLLQRRADTGKWGVIGGIVEPGEEPAAAVVREVREETSVVVDPLAITGVYTTPVITYANGDRAQYILTAFYCYVVEGTPRVNDDESLEVAYFPLSALPELSPAHALRLKHAAEIRHSTAHQGPFFVGRDVRTI